MTMTQVLMWGILIVSVIHIAWDISRCVKVKCSVEELDPADEELAKLEREVEFLELKIKSKKLENELKGWG